MALLGVLRVKDRLTRLPSREAAPCEVGKIAPEGRARVGMESRLSSSDCICTGRAPLL